MRLTYRLTSAAFIVAGGASLGLAFGVLVLGDPWWCAGVGACLGIYDSKWWLS